MSAEGARIIDANVLQRTGETWDRSLTVPGVVEELEDGGHALERHPEMEVREPSREAVEEVLELAGEINSPTSDADEALVALALEFGGQLVSDDFAVQNLAELLEVEYSGFMEDEISETREWELVCNTCGREVESGRCSCGGEAVRRTAGSSPV